VVSIQHELKKTNRCAVSTDFSWAKVYRLCS